MHKVILAAMILASPAVWAGFENFSTGPVVEEFGPAAVVAAASVPDSATFKIAFDLSEAAKPEKTNTGLESAARLLNMHAKAGLSADDTEVAIVVHGGAAMDLVTDERRGEENPNAVLVAALIDAGVTIQLCGQTAAYRDIEAQDLLPGVSLSVSAMTAHALLQQNGFTLNPF